VINLMEVEKGRLDKNYFIKKAHVDGAFGINMRDYQAKGIQFSRAS